MREPLEKCYWQARNFARRQQIVDADFLEKYAELIVRECVMLCDKVYEQNDNVKIQAGATFCREDIKQHFGVE